MAYTKGGEKYSGIIEKFISYCLNEDKIFIHTPRAIEYIPQSHLIKDLEVQWVRSNSEDMVLQAISNLSD